MDIHDSPLANGAHSLTATATDPAGNISVASAAMAVTVDTVAPNAPNITSFSPDTGTVGDGVTTANVLMLTGTAEANATVKVYDGTTLLGSVAANSSGAWTYTTAALANGAHSLTATATDVGRQYRYDVIGLGGHNYDGAIRPDDCLILT